MITVNSQLGKSYNSLSNGSRQLSRGLSMDGISWAGKTHPVWVTPFSKQEIPDCVKVEKSSSSLACMHSLLFFFWLDASGSCCLDAPIMMGCNKLWGEINPLMLLPENFVTAMGKRLWHQGTLSFCLYLPYTGITCFLPHTWHRLPDLNL